MMRFGPAGLGGVKQAVSNLEKYKKSGLEACEVAFTYSVYIKKQQAIEIGKHVKKLGIFLSVHAPYWINLNSKDKRKKQQSADRILKSCEIAHYLNARRVVFHAGYYSGMEKEKTFENIKKVILDLKKQIKREKWNVEICPETTGKKNVFGSVEEISRLVKETKCGFCIDFAHVLSRYKNYEFDLIKKSFKDKKWHCHFSGIVYGEKGERHHKITPEKEWRKVLGFLKSIKKDVVIINESPDPVGDSVKGLKIWEGID